MAPTGTRAAAADRDLIGPVRSYIRVLIIEVLVIAGLYWAGRYFG